MIGADEITVRAWRRQLESDICAIDGYLRASGHSARTRIVLTESLRALAAKMRDREEEHVLTRGHARRWLTNHEIQSK